MWAYRPLRPSVSRAGRSCLATARVHPAARRARVVRLFMASTAGGVWRGTLRPGVVRAHVCGRVRYPVVTAGVGQ